MSLNGPDFQDRGPSSRLFFPGGLFLGLNEFPKRKTSTMSTKSIGAPHAALGDFICGLLPVIAPRLEAILFPVPRICTKSLWPFMPLILKDAGPLARVINKVGLPGRLCWRLLFEAWKLFKFARVHWDEDHLILSLTTCLMLTIISVVRSQTQVVSFLPV